MAKIDRLNFQHQWGLFEIDKPFTFFFALLPFLPCFLFWLQPNRLLLGTTCHPVKVENQGPVGLGTPT